MEEVSMLSLRKGGIKKQCCSSNHAWTCSTESSATVSSTSSPAARSDLKQVLSHPWILLPRQRPFHPISMGAKNRQNWLSPEIIFLVAD